jgi:long-subunit fatty acid transport protein
MGLATQGLDAQAPPVTLPDRIAQDQLDFQGRASLFLGSGARALGMGGAFLARADDATAATWNPAGLSYLRWPELSVVGVRNSFDADLSTASAVLERDSLSSKTPDFLALTYPVSLGETLGAVQVSFQRVIPYNGSRTIVRARADREVFLDADGGFDVIALGSGVQVSRGVRVGVTLNRWGNGYRQTTERTVRRRGTNFADFRFSGFNLNLGIIWSPFESLNLGAVGKTPFTGSVVLSKERTDLALDLPGIPPDTPADTVTSNAFSAGNIAVDIPGAVGFGASWRPMSNLTLSADYTRTFWSQGEIRGFFTLPPGSLGGPGPVPKPPEDVFTALPFPTLDPSRAQADSDQLRMGAEYVVLFRRLKWPLRAGYFSDRQFFRIADGRAPRFNGGSVGTGVIVGPLLLDAAYSAEWGSYSEIDPESGARIRTSRTFHRLFVSIIYRHGRGKP